MNPPANVATEVAAQTSHLFHNATNFDIFGGQYILGDVHNHHTGPHIQSSSSLSSITQDEAFSESEVYCNQMLRLKRGFPLYEPAPQINLPAAYRRHGVSIGDVGSVTAEGIFDFFFNIFLPPEHLINGNRTPQDFSPMPFYQSVDVSHLHFPPGNHVSTSTVQRLDLDAASDEFPGGEFVFNCDGPQGAVLALPYGAHLQKLRNIENIRTYTAKHAASWYKYINGPRGRGLANGELYLVTGYEKAQSWGMASYYANHENFDLVFQPVNNQYRWSGTPGKKNPSRKKSHDPPQVEPGDDQPLNHTTFIQGLSITIGTGLWNRLFGTVTVETSSIADLQSLTTTSGSYVAGSNRSSGFWSWSSLGAGSTTGRKHRAQHEEVVLSELSPSSNKVYNPAKLVNEHIIRKTPNATVVMSHDDDWSDMLGNYPAIADLADLLRWIDDEFAITEKDGATFLRRKLGYPRSSSANDTLPLSQGTSKGNLEKKDTEANSDGDELIEWPVLKRRRRETVKSPVSADSDPKKRGQPSANLDQPNIPQLQLSSLAAGSAAVISANEVNSTPEWGRVLICGGTDWPRLGRKGAKSEPDGPSPDLLEPHILRSLSNIKATSIHTSAHSCHCVVLDVDGVAWLFGRNGSSALGEPNTVDSISENAPKRLTASNLGAAATAKFVDAACGRDHTLLVSSDGALWSAGINNLGQCGHPVSPDVPTFKNVAVMSEGGAKEHVVKATAGISFSAVLTDTGKVYTFGSGEKGQLGNGKTGERIITGNKLAFDIVTQPTQVDGIDNRKIVQISAGQQHCIALDSTGLVYVWGYGSHCRLGLGTQADELRPKMVPIFAGPNELLMGAFVAAGPSNSVVVDRQGMYWMTGKWKKSGEGSSVSPYSSFRYMQDIMACKVTRACCGGVTHWLLTPDDDDPETGEPTVMTVAWGQNAANGELGLGPEEPKSATKPTKHIPLTGVNVIDIAAGQNTTLFLAKPNGRYSNLPRYPVDVEPPEACIQCEEDHGDDGPEVLECGKCDAPYHLSCLTPPLESIPEGEWFCPDCEAEPGASVGAAAKKLKSKSLKRKAELPAKAAPQKKKKQ